MMATSKEEALTSVSAIPSLWTGAPSVYHRADPLGRRTISWSFCSVNEAVNMTFSERNKRALKWGSARIDFFFGMGSVAYYVSMSIASLSEGGRKGDPP